ncbi:MAG: HD-GYP domain-containing protein [Clostridiales bacterium]|jgi:putative two-component system response regulator|nr:HD-GYP domain-containing protein [Clostridiales bacterium]
MTIKVKALFKVMSDMIAFRDDVTGGHLSRTSLYLEVLICRMAKRGLYSNIVSQWDLTLLLGSASLHDIGKIAISEKILYKPGKLTEEEFETIKTHTVLGVEILDRIEIPAEEKHCVHYARSIAGSHHEKWDGTGYPDGAYGLHIPLEGRLMAIADVYDALISNRPYKRALLPAEAAVIIEEGSGTHFDPRLVDIFHDVAHIFEVIASANVGRHTEAYGVKETHMPRSDGAAAGQEAPDRPFPVRTPDRLLRKCHNERLCRDLLSKGHLKHCATLAPAL